MNEILNEGDEVVCITHSTLSSKNKTYYKFDKVVRVTKTTAILESGKILNRNGIRDWKMVVIFGVRGKKYEASYTHCTPEIKSASKIEKERQLIDAWFKDYKFSDKEKKTIYELIKN